MRTMSLITFLLSLVSCQQGGFVNLDVAGFEELIAKPEVAVLDVRTADEYAAGHLPWASSIDWYAEDFLQKVEAAYPKATPLAVYCRSGRRSAEAAAKLTKAGYTVSNLKGGYLAWTEAQQPVTQYAVETFLRRRAFPSPSPLSSTAPWR